MTQNRHLIQDLLKRPIAFQRIFATIVGCAAGGLFLSQLYYWSTDNKAHDSENFIYKTFQEWQAETGISRREWENARTKLKSLGLLEEQRRGLNPQLWYKLDLDRLCETIERSGSDRNAQNPRHSGIVTSDISQSKIEHQLSLDPPSPDAIFSVRSIYTESTNHKLPPESTRIEPERASKKLAEFVRSGSLTMQRTQAVERDRDPEIEPEILVGAEPVTRLVVAIDTSGSQEDSASDDITLHNIPTHGSTQAFDDSWHNNLSPQMLGELAAELVRLYAAGSPDRWARCDASSHAIKKRIKLACDRYRADDREVKDLVEDFKAALLFYKSSEFHSSPKFGSGNIYWLLEGDRIEVAASKWDGSSEAAKTKLARSIVEEQNSRPEWGSGDLLSGDILRGYIRGLTKMVERNSPNLPPREWLLQHYPEVFK